MAILGLKNLNVCRAQGWGCIGEGASDPCSVAPQPAADKKSAARDELPTCSPAELQLDAWCVLTSAISLSCAVLFLTRIRSAMPKLLKVTESHLSDLLVHEKLPPLSYFMKLTRGTFESSLITRDKTQSVEYYVPADLMARRSGS